MNSKNGMLRGLKYHKMIFKMPCVSQTNSMVLMYKCIVQDFQPPKTKTYGDYKYQNMIKVQNWNMLIAFFKKYFFQD